MPEPLISARLIARGATLDPNVITTAVSVNPTRTWKSGDAIGASLLSRSDSGWLYALPLRRGFAIAPIIIELLDTVEPWTERLLNAIDSGSTSLTVFCGIQFCEQAPDCSIDRDTIQRIGRLGAGLAIDVVLRADESVVT